MDSGLMWRDCPSYSEPGPRGQRTSRPGPESPSHPIRVIPPVTRMISTASRYQPTVEPLPTPSSSLTAAAASPSPGTSTELAVASLTVTRRRTPPARYGCPRVRRPLPGQPGTACAHRSGGSLPPAAPGPVSTAANVTVPRSARPDSHTSTPDLAGTSTWSCDCQRHAAGAAGAGASHDDDCQGAAPGNAPVLVAACGSLSSNVRNSRFRQHSTKFDLLPACGSACRKRTGAAAAAAAGLDGRRRHQQIDP